jgi:hypothetical protein
MLVFSQPLFSKSKLYKQPHLLLAPPLGFKISIFSISKI